VLDKRAISHIHCHDSHMTDASLGSLGSGLGFKQWLFFGRYRGLSTVAAQSTGSDSHLHFEPVAIVG
jgi:hypothetical protein